MFQVKIDKGLSMGMIEEMVKNGRVVFRTPHVGNWALDNITTLATGVAHNVFDRNLTKKDNLFYPDRVSFTSKVKIKDDILCTHLPREVRDTHIGKLKSLYPNSNVFTTSELVEKHRGLYEEILDIVAEDIYSLVDRYVLSNGKVIERTPVSAKNLKQCCFQLFGNDKEGFLLPLEVEIMIETIIQYQESQIKDGTVYHISGPAMYLYISGIRDVMNNLYLKVAKKLNLPKLTLVIIPMHLLRLVSLQKDKAMIDELIDLYFSHKKLAKERGEKIKSANSKEKGLLVKEFKARFSYLEDKITLWSLNYYKKVFYVKTEGPNFVCQRDIKKADDIYIHPILFDLTSRELESMEKFFKKYYLAILKKIGVTESDLLKIKNMK